jgi:RNA polymerase sigma factor (sigma-70 family)
MTGQKTMRPPLKTNNPIQQQNLGDLVEEYQPGLKAYVSRHTGNSDDADDILQDVFYQLVKTVQEAVNPIEHVSAWLYTAARNRIINLGRKKKEEKMPVSRNTDQEDVILTEFSEILFGEEDSMTPEMEYLRSLVWVELENALSELPPEQREIFELTEIEGLPVKEISYTTGVSINTLLSRKHYAVLHIRKRLADLYQDIITR